METFPTAAARLLPPQTGNGFVPSTNDIALLLLEGNSTHTPATLAEFYGAAENSALSCYMPCLVGPIGPRQRELWCQRLQPPMRRGAAMRACAASHACTSPPANSTNQPTTRHALLPCCALTAAAYEPVEVDMGDALAMVGWGVTEQLAKGEPAATQVLQFADMELTAAAQCADSWPGVDNTTNICAGGCCGRCVLCPEGNPLASMQAERLQPAACSLQPARRVLVRLLSSCLQLPTDA